MRFILLCAFLISQYLAVTGQEYSVLVKVSDTFTKQKSSINDDPALKAVKQAYNLKDFVPCYPGAKNPELLKYYYIRGESNKQNVIQALNNSGNFTEVTEEEQVYLLSCSNPVSINDYLLANNYANDDLQRLTDAYCAWSITKGHPDVHIGVADTYFETSHEDLTNQLLPVGGPVTTQHHHGTWVAGIAAAETNNAKGVAGIGYNSSIAAERIQLSSPNSAPTSRIRTAVWNLYQDGVPVINASWSGTGLNVLATEEITQSGTTLVLAGGNSVGALNHIDIANTPGVILVTSINSANEHGPTGHEHNAWIDICAPGDNVSTTDNGNGYASCWGTSCAAPAVAGTVALMMAVNPCLTPEVIELLIEQTADPIADASSYPGLLGAGRINAHEALLAAIEHGRQSNSGNYTGTQTITAPSELVTSGTVYNGANITLQAPMGVELAPGFSVQPGGLMNIVLDYNCSFNRN